MKKLIPAALMLTLLSGCGTTPQSQYPLFQQTNQKYDKVVLTVNTHPTNSESWAEHLSNGKSIAVYETPLLMPYTSRYHYMPGQQINAHASSGLPLGPAILGEAIAGVIINAAERSAHEDYIRRRNRLLKALNEVDLAQTVSDFPRVDNTSWASDLSVKVIDDKVQLPQPSDSNVLNGNLTWSTRPIFSKHAVTLCFEFRFISQRSKRFGGGFPSVIDFNLCGHEQSPGDANDSMENWEKNHGALITKAMQTALPLLAKTLTYSLEQEMQQQQSTDNEQRMHRVKEFNTLFTDQKGFMDASYQFLPVATYFVDFSV